MSPVRIDVWVPFFVIGGRVAVSGAQPPEVLVGALRRLLTMAQSEAVDAPSAVGAGCPVDSPRSTP